MLYLAINFRNPEETPAIIEKLLSLHYVFTYSHRSSTKRLKDLGEIISIMNSTGCAILLGKYACKMEWQIHLKTFYTDDCYTVVTLDEFLNHHTDFESEDYANKFGTVEKVPLREATLAPAVPRYVDEMETQLLNARMRRFADAAIITPPHRITFTYDANLYEYNIATNETTI